MKMKPVSDLAHGLPEVPALLKVIPALCNAMLMRDSGKLRVPIQLRVHFRILP